MTERKTEGGVTARDFNPSENPVVDGIKSRVEELAKYINENVPAGRRRSIALTNLETASMYAVKANFYQDPPPNDMPEGYPRGAQVNMEKPAPKPAVEEG